MIPEGRTISVLRKSREFISGQHDIDFTNKADKAAIKLNQIEEMIRPVQRNR